MNCAVKDCYSNYDCHQKDSSITFHRFPKACHKVWQKLAGLSSDNWKWQPNQKICSVHFEEHCFDRTGQTVRLHEDAMPTLLLPNLDVQEGEHSDPHLQPQSIPLSKPKETSAENIDYSKSNLDAIKSTSDSGEMDKSVPVSSNELGYSSLPTVITISSTSELDIKTEPLFMEMEEEQEVDFASLNILPEISIKSLQKPSAIDIKTEISPEIDVTDYSISNITTIKTEPTMEMESDRSAMSCVDFPSAVKVEIDLDSSTIIADSTTTIKSETRVIQDGSSGDSDHKTDTMVPIKDELKDYSISYHDDFNSIKLKKNTNNIEEIACKNCQTYFSDWISLGHHLEDCYRRVCGQTFTSSLALGEHALTHESPSTYTKFILKERISTKSRCYKCRFCKISYKFPAELRYHIMTHTTVKHCLCSYCGNNFSLSHRSKCERTHSLHSHTHILKKTDNKTSDSLKTERRFDCSVCKKSYRRRKSLFNHKCIITSKKSHNSSHCGKRFVVSNQFVRIGSDLRQHARTRIGEKLYQCSHCGKGFTTQRVLTEHIRTHTGVKPYECPHCSKRFSQLYNLNRHKLTHTGKKPYECSHCNQRFTEQGSLNRHLRRHNGGKPYECSDCSKKYTYASDLTKHKNIHNSENPYECSHCSKRFTTRRYLTKHMRTHTGEKPYVCSQCNKCYTDARYLTEHIRSHTGEKPYECPHCSKRLTSQRVLTRHILIHTGEKPYECSHCSKRFTQKGQLTIHERWHTGEKPYECLHCKKRFITQPVLTTHMSTHTGEKPYECLECSKRFTVLSSLNRHKLTHTAKN